jgi:hypothetical protein
MTKTAIVWSCAHADPEAGNERFDWLSKLIQDIKPDYAVDLGDGADMRSLNSYDTRYPRAIVSQSYQADIEAYNESQDRLWSPFKKLKKRRPWRIGFEGNHEYRIKKAIMHDPRLEGDKFGISFSHLQTRDWFDEYHEYSNSAPAVADYDGVLYSHFFSAGNTSTAMSGIHHAYGLVHRFNTSVTCGHSHKRSVYFKDSSFPNPNIGLVVGCFKGKDESWAGQSNREWWRGVVIKRDLQNGHYDPEFISMDRLRNAYA